MRFIVALLIASLFVDKADSELSFIPRPKACIHALHISRSQQYSHPYPITSIPQASYPFSFDRGGGASPNRKTPIGFRDNQARTDDFHHVKHALFETGRRRTDSVLVEAEPSQDDMNHPFFLRQGSYYHFRRNWSYFSFPFPFQSSYVFPRPFLRNTYKKKG
ncbi:hypothetical protein M5K25_028354 [Dendrobium thyrsiflorum]|uniref:Uncharacterized protein n=1 Tax=Dendrobium thyrsiflorum TaxID=117978 RepID=A0ABD0TTH8_DENTH